MSRVSYTCKRCGDAVEKFGARCGNCGSHSTNIGFDGKPDTYQQRKYAEMKANGPSEADCRFTDMPICPYCGAEMSSDELYESTERDCDECGHDVYIGVDYSVTYTTSKIEPVAVCPEGKG